MYLEVDDEGADPTGWGPLPLEPTDKYRKSNKAWDDLYGDWRDEHWETVEDEDENGV